MSGTEGEGALNDQTMPCAVNRPLQELRRSVRKKRNSSSSGPSAAGLTSGPGSSSRAGLSQGSSGPRKVRKTGLVKNSEGFFDIHVEYSHCVEMANGCGLKPADVVQTIEEDNMQRGQITEQPQSDEEDEEGPQTGHGIGDHDVSFDPDSEDVLLSEEE